MKKNMKKNMKKIGTVAGASVAAFALGATLAGGMAIATADDENNGTTESAPWGFGRGGGPMGDGPMRGGHGPMGGAQGRGEIVTGEDAQKAIDAATAAVPGTADHVHRLPDGTYRVMVRAEDGTVTVVTLDAGFAVTDTQEMSARGPGRGHGEPATDEQTAAVTAAVLDRLPDATVLHVMVAPDGGYVALARTDAGRKRIVLLDEEYTITEVRKDQGRRHGPGHHGRFGDDDVVGPAFRKAERAALAEVPGGTVMDVHKVGKRYMVAVRKDDGTMVLVRMTGKFTVKGTQELQERGPRMGSPTSF